MRLIDKPAVLNRYMDEIIKHYGGQRQKMKAIEELTGLAETVARDLNRAEMDRADIIDSLADGFLMVCELRRIYEIPEEEMQETLTKKLRKVMKDVKFDKRFDKYIAEYSHHDESSGRC